MQTSSILDQVSAQRTQSTVFGPKSPAEVFALRLAQRLRDPASAAHYASLLGKYSETQLLLAYKRMMKNADGEFGQRFHRELSTLPTNVSNGHDVKLLALRLERRAVGAAMFFGDRLEYTQVRQLSSANDKAVASAVGFVNWLSEQFSPYSAAIELVAATHPMHRRALADAVVQTLRDRAVPVWEIPRSHVLEGFGHPPLKSRQELRQVITGIWPLLSSSGAKRFIADAVALGLYAQVERSFLY